MFTTLNMAASAALRWLAPAHCAACDVELTAATPGQGDAQAANRGLTELFCRSCALSFSSSQSPDAAIIDFCSCPVHALGCYEGPLKKAVVRFKYNNAPVLARPLASALFGSIQALTVEKQQAPPPLLWTTATLVPVPIHPARLAERGYNQAALLAVQLGKLSGLRCDTALLRRHRLGPRQAELKREARLQNMLGQIGVRRAPEANVVLVDDVLTTGSTLRACVEAVNHAGGSVIQALALAWTP